MVRDTVKRNTWGRHTVRHTMSDNCTVTRNASGKHMVRHTMSDIYMERHTTMDNCNTSGSHMERHTMSDSHRESRRENYTISDNRMGKCGEQLRRILPVFHSL